MRQGAPGGVLLPDADVLPVVCGQAGNMYLSADAGQTWTQSFTSTGAVPGFLGSPVPAFPDAQTGYFGYGAGFAIKSIDGGASWTQISSGTGESLNDMDRFANGNLIAVGENGAVLTSTGTPPWILHEPFTTSHVVAVQVIGPQEVVAVDETARVYSSADGGATWMTAAAAPVGLEAEDLHFTTLLDGWVTGFGLGGAAVFHTTDGGTTWTSVPGFTGAYVAVDFEGMNGWAANVSGRFYRTIDGGATWIQGDLPGSPLQIQDMDFFDVSIGYAVGWWGYAVRSDDAGATWQVLPTPNGSDQLTDIYLLGPNELWVSTNAGVAYSSATGGQNWAVMDVGSAGFASTGHAQSAWADYDGDQDLDLLLVHLAPLSDDGFIRRYRNDGGGVFVGEDILGNLTIEHGEAQWGDYDADGDLDILVAGHIKELDGTYTTVLRIYRNDAETYVPIEVIACPSCEGWWDLTAATWADYDSDGDVDILLAGNYNSGSQIDGRAKIYDNVGGVFTDSGSQLPAPRAAGSRGGSFTWLDIDREGDLDYFIAGQYFVPGGNGLVEAQMHVYRNDAQDQNEAPSAPSFLATTVDGSDGTVDFWWSPASDDFTPTHSLTYDLQLYRNGAPASPPRRLPEPGSLSAFSQWTLTGLPDGIYTWTLRAVDSAYNGGQAAEDTFTLGAPPAADIFTDGFESGDLSGWSAASP